MQEFFDESLKIKTNNTYLKYQEVEAQKAKKEKTFDRTMLKRKARYTSPPNHPWRRDIQQAKLRAQRQSL